MKVKKYQILKKKFFKFDLSLLHSFFLVLTIFLIALIWAKTDHYLTSKLDSNENQIFNQYRKII